MPAVWTWCCSPGSCAGCTIHLVEDALDTGPILDQAVVEVRESDTPAALEARVHAAEHELYPRTVRRFLMEPWRLEGRRFVFGEGAGLVLPEEETARG